MGTHVNIHAHISHIYTAAPQEWDKIWTVNKRLIDPVAPRHTAVTAADRVPLTLSDGPEVEEVQVVPRHKKNPALGSKVSVRSKVRPEPRTLHAKP